MHHVPIGCRRKREFPSCSDFRDNGVVLVEDCLVLISYLSSEHLLESFAAATLQKYPIGLRNLEKLQIYLRQIFSTVSRDILQVLASTAGTTLNTQKNFVVAKKQFLTFLLPFVFNSTVMDDLSQLYSPQNPFAGSLFFLRNPICSRVFIVRILRLFC